MGCVVSARYRPFNDAFEIKGPIKFGMFAAEERASKEQYAVKVIARDKSGLEELKRLSKLIEPLKESKHFVQCVSFRTDAEVFYIVMERCQGTLSLQLRESSWDLKKATETFKQVLKGLAFLHSKNMVHRNVKPSNIFYTIERGYTVVKLGDFSLATPLPNHAQQLYEEVGSPSYMSVEMLLGHGYREKTDVWSFGVMAYAVLYGEFPYAPREVSSAAIKNTIMSSHNTEPRFLQVPTLRDACSDAPRCCLRALLHRDPALRSSAEKALQLTFLSGQETIEAEAELASPLLSREMLSSLAEAAADADGSDSERSEFSSLLMRKAIPGLLNHE